MCPLHQRTEHLALACQTVQNPGKGPSHGSFILVGRCAGMPKEDRIWGCPYKCHGLQGRGSARAQGGRRADRGMPCLGQWVVEAPGVSLRIPLWSAAWNMSHFVSGGSETLVLIPVPRATSLSRWHSLCSSPVHLAPRESALLYFYI